MLTFHFCWSRDIPSDFFACFYLDSFPSVLDLLKSYVIMKFLNVRIMSFGGGIDHDSN